MVFIFLIAVCIVSYVSMKAGLGESKILEGFGKSMEWRHTTSSDSFRQIT